MRRFFLIVAAALFAIGPVSSAPMPTDSYLIHIFGGGLGVTTDDTISISRIGHRWIIERLVRDHNWCGKQSFDRHNPCITTDVVRHEWADGGNCPEISRAMLQIADAWRSDEIIPDNMRPTVTDNPKFTIAAKRGSKNIRADRTAAEFGGPLSAWWRNTKARIYDCWSDAAPLSSGVPIKPRLFPTWN